VLLRLPLNPLVPELAQQSVSPFVSVMVTVVLLNVALMWATPTATLRLVLRRLEDADDPDVLATLEKLLHVPVVSLEKQPGSRGILPTADP
jgi:hypothetical protein